MKFYQFVKRLCLVTQRKLKASPCSVYKYRFTTFRRKLRLTTKIDRKTICLRYESRLHLKSGFLHVLLLLVFHLIRTLSLHAYLTLSAARNKLAYNHWGLNLLLARRTVVVVFNGWVPVMAGHRLHSGRFQAQTPSGWLQRWLANYVRCR